MFKIQGIFWTRHSEELMFCFCWREDDLTAKCWSAMSSGLTVDCTEPHWTTPGPYQARNDWLVRFDNCYELRVKFKGIRRANYPQLIKGVNSSRRSWWVGFKVSMDVFNIPVEAQAPGVQGECCHMRAKSFSTSKNEPKHDCGLVWVRCGLEQLLVIHLWTLLIIIWFVHADKVQLWLKPKTVLVISSDHRQILRVLR